jgi:hypothetical protein
MHVDRKRFLYLVSAIAAGCGGRDEPSPTVPPPVIIAEPEPLAAPEEVLVPVEPSPEPTVAAPPTAEEDEGWTVGPTPAPSWEGGYLPPSSAGAMCRAGAVKASPGSGCRDEVGNPGSCSGGRMTSLCGALQFHCSKCDSYRKYFKPRVAERAVACVQGQSLQQAQDGCETYRCGDEALKAACRDATAVDACRSIVGPCNASLSECTQLLSGMNAAGRAEVAACVAQGCRYGLWSCVEGM